MKLEEVFKGQRVVVNNPKDTTHDKRTGIVGELAPDAGAFPVFVCLDYGAVWWFDPEELKEIPK